MDITKMLTKENYNRCIKAGVSMKELPEDFVIRVSKHEVTDVKLTGKYQVQHSKTSFLQPDRNPCLSFGLTQFINCCLPRKSTINLIGNQNMKKKQCEIIVRLYHELKYKDISPTYVLQRPQSNKVVVAAQRVRWPSQDSNLYLSVPCLVYLRLTCFIECSSNFENIDCLSHSPFLPHFVKRKPNENCFSKMNTCYCSL